MLRSAVMYITQHPVIVIVIVYHWMCACSEGVADVGCLSKQLSKLFFGVKSIAFRYLIRLMSSWAVVCDVWFLEPQVWGLGFRV